MIPRLGDSVWFYRNRVSEPLAATISYLHTTSALVKWSGPASVKSAGTSEQQIDCLLVNLMVVAEDGIPFNKIEVPFVETDVTPDGGWCKPRGAIG